MGFGMPPPGGPPQGPPPGGPPPGAPPGMGGPPPPPMPPPGGPPPGAPPPGVPGASPKPSVYSDLSVSMPPQWQLIDVAARNINSGLQTGAFYKTPGVYAALKEIHHELTRLISAYSAGQMSPLTEETSRRSGSPNESAFDGTSTQDNEPMPVDSSPDE